MTTIYDCVDCFVLDSRWRPALDTLIGPYNYLPYLLLSQLSVFLPRPPATGQGFIACTLPLPIRKPDFPPQSFCLFLLFLDPEPFLFLLFTYAWMLISVPHADRCAGVLGLSAFIFIPIPLYDDLLYVHRVLFLSRLSSCRVYPASHVNPQTPLRAISMITPSPLPVFLFALPSLPLLIFEHL